MPKKTKKQKILALVHRRRNILQSFQEQQAASPVSQSINPPAQQYKLSEVYVPKTQFSQGRTNNLIQNHSYAIADLRRIIFLSLLALILETIVYFALHH